MTTGARSFIGARRVAHNVRRFEFPKLGRVVYGVGAIDGLRTEVERLGAHRVFLITSPSTSRQQELMTRIRKSLGNLLVAEFHEAVAHVPLASVQAAVETAKDSEVDLVLSLGGGSPIDCGKAVALCAPTIQPVEVTLGSAIIDTSGKDQGGVLHAPLPHITVSTTLSAAEFTPTFTVTDPVMQAKVMYYDERFTPTTVVLDASATTGTPSWLWTASGIRAIDHCVEWYLSAAHTPFTDALAISALPMLWRSLPVSVSNEDDLEARQDCQLAAWMSVYGSSNVLGGLSHAIGHQLGSHTGMTHGYTSCVILPHVIDFNRAAVPERVAELAAAVGLTDNNLSTGLGRLLDKLKMPRTISSATENEVNLDAIAEATMTEVAIVNNPREVRIEDVRRILEKAR